MAILPTDIRILFTNYEIITYFLNLASCSEHFISIKHRILATFNISKKIQFWQPLNIQPETTTSLSVVKHSYVDKIQVLAWNMHTNVAGLNRVMSLNRPPSWNWTVEWYRQRK
jgi:hypothetical protein